MLFDDQPAIEAPIMQEDAIQQDLESLDTPIDSDTNGTVGDSLIDSIPE